MRLTFTDPDNVSTSGSWTNEDPISGETIEQGGVFSLEFDVTSSDGAEILYDLSAAPAFGDNILIQCHVDETGALQIKLARGPDEEGIAFGSISNFRDLIRAGGGSASGTSATLLIPHKLPGVVDWSAIP